MSILRFALVFCGVLTCTSRGSASRELDELLQGLVDFDRIAVNDADADDVNGALCVLGADKLSRDLRRWCAHEREFVAELAECAGREFCPRFALSGEDGARTQAISMGVAASTSPRAALAMVGRFGVAIALGGTAMAEYGGIALADGEVAIAGDFGLAINHRGAAFAGDHGTAVSPWGLASAGERGEAYGGSGSVLRAGRGGMLVFVPPTGEPLVWPVDGNYVKAHRYYRLVNGRITEATGPGPVDETPKADRRKEQTPTIRERRRRKLFTEI